MEINSNNKQVVQSYLFTASRYDFNAYEKRIIYMLVKLCQRALAGQALNGFKIKDVEYEGLKDVYMPISAFLKDNSDKHYEMVKNALKSLRNKTIEIQDENVWRVIGIIEMPKLDVDKRGYVKFLLQKEIYEAILSFSKGYRRYELGLAMSFNSVYTMRFYELISGKEGNVIAYNINTLKEMFKLENKYKQNRDFIKIVIDTARNELIAKSPVYFDYQIVRDGRKFKAITFIVKKNENYVPPADEEYDNIEINEDVGITDVEFESEDGIEEAEVVEVENTEQKTQKRKKNNSGNVKLIQNPGAYELNEWAKTYFDEKYINSASLDTFDKLLRIDKYTAEQVKRAIEWARRDDFWTTNFLTPLKLRNKDKNGVKYIDVFLAKTLKNKNYGTNGKQRGVTDEEFAEILRDTLNYKR